MTVIIHAIFSCLYNLSFYIVTTLFCLLLLPTLILPRKIMMAAVYVFVHVNTFLEKHIMGLDYEVRGAEHLPKEGSYIIAAKHQSSYETFKLHILFNNPAIVLKKELLKIPLWGLYLRKSDSISIDRSSPKTAIASIQDGARRMKAQNRPIIIFPQGTRVLPEETAKDKPYKTGIARVQEATGLPIIPLALNSGFFSPKKSWWKKSGTVIFEFLPQIEASDERKPKETVKKIEMAIEEKSSLLLDEAKKGMKEEEHTRHTSRKTGFKIVAAIFIAYSLNWMIAVHIVQSSLLNMVKEYKENSNIGSIEIAPLMIYGFPGKIRIKTEHIKIETLNATINISDLAAQSWPLSDTPFNLQTGGVEYKSHHLDKAISIDYINARVRLKDDITLIQNALIGKGETLAILNGAFSIAPPYPRVGINISIVNYSIFLRELARKQIISKRIADMTSFALQALEQYGQVNAQILSKENKVFMGPIKLYEFPLPPKAQPLENGQPSAHATSRDPKQ